MHAARRCAAAAPAGARWRWCANDAASRKKRGLKEEDAHTKYSSKPDVGHLLSHGLETSSDTASKSQDPNAPQGRAERKEFLKAQMSGWEAPQKSDKTADFEKRNKMVFVNAWGYKDLTEDERKEQAWLAKREKELEKKGVMVMGGLGFLITLWMLYTQYQRMTSKRGKHPAATCYVGTTVEVTLQVDEKIYEKPLVFGLFTQRAPHACENFIRLITGDNERGFKLEGTEFFRYEQNSILYGGVPEGKDARAGMVALPGSTLRIPYEDPELPPFDYALVSCAKAFVQNGGFTSVFGILDTDNPPQIGHKECEEFDIVASGRMAGSFRQGITGVKREYLRKELDPQKDGAYVFGVLVDGRDVFKHVLAQLHSKEPYFRPRERVIVKSCRVRDTDLPGRKEAINPDAVTDADGRPDLSKVHAALAKEKAERAA